MHNLVQQQHEKLQLMIEKLSDNGTILRMGFYKQYQVAVLADWYGKSGHEVLGVIGNKAYWIPARLLTEKPEC